MLIIVKSFSYKFRNSAIDPSLPTYVKIPGRPIPRSWAHTILQLSEAKPAKTPCGSHYHEVDDILSLDLKQFGTSFTAVYMDPPLLLPDEEPTPGKISIDDLVNI